MTTPTVLDVAALGVRVEIRKSAAQTDGELVEFDVVGRARGFIAQAHVHAAQSERHEVIEGTMRLVVGGREHLLGPGQAMEVPAGTSHRQLPGDEGHGRVRVQLRPAGRTEEFLERLAQLSASAAFNRWRLPAAAGRRGARARLRRRRPRLAAAGRGAARRRGGAPAPRVERVPLRRRVGRRRASGRCLRGARRRSQLPGLVAAGLPGRRGGGPARGRHALAPALQGPPAVPPAHAARGSSRTSRRACSRSTSTAIFAVTAAGR